MEIFDSSIPGNPISLVIAMQPQYNYMRKTVGKKCPCNIQRRFAASFAHRLFCFLAATATATAVQHSNHPSRIAVGGRTTAAEHVNRGIDLGRIDDDGDGVHAAAAGPGGPDRPLGNAAGKCVQGCADVSRGCENSLDSNLFNLDRES